jgi:hypothetical protein
MLVEDCESEMRDRKEGIGILTPYVRGSRRVTNRGTMEGMNARG